MDQATPPAGTFAAVAAGNLHTCGLKSDGTVSCWGSNKDEWGNTCNQATPPAGTFTSISAGAFNTCGVRTDGSIACWGKNNDGESTPPK